MDLDDDLRPDTWDQVVGQDSLQHELRLRTAAALEEARPLDHVLLVAPPGSGKTSVARVVANELGEPFRILTMPAEPMTVAHTVSDFRGVLLLDELHAARPVQHMLLRLVEDGYVEVDAYRYVPEWLTVIGATTEGHLLIPALVERFPVVPAFDAYSDDETAEIVTRMAARLGLAMDAADAAALGRAAAGAPRAARRMVLAYRDLATQTEHPSAAAVLSLLRVDDDGLTQAHRNYLRVLDGRRGRAGLRTLVTTMRVHQGVVLDLERLLVDRGLVATTDRGRILTPAGLARARTLRAA